MKTAAQENRLSLVVRESATCDRATLESALGRCTAPQRAMLAMLLLERLSFEETAAALRLSMRQFRHSYDGLVDQLRLAVERDRKTAAREALVLEPALRKAS